MLNLSASIDNKSDDNANKFRESGNAQYSTKQYSKALILYNKSITYAWSKKVLSLGYANRSAVYFELGYYEECLKNIEWARENDYPKDKMSKLDEREEKCKKLMLEEKKNIDEDPWNFFKLSYPANEKIPWIVDCLEVRTTEKYGRGIYATKDLKAGDIISIGEPFIHFSMNDGCYKHCNNCFKTCMMNLIPCTRTASMMFCSNDCMDKFYSASIKMEIALHANMKLLSKITSSFGGYKKFDEFINKTDLKDLKKTIFDFDLSNPKDSEYDKNLATCFLSLNSIINPSIPNGRMNNYVSTKAANHITGILTTNTSFCVYDNGELRAPFFDGSSIHLFRSLINHSCVSNVNFVCIDNKEVAFVLKPIKAGEQLMYGYHDKHQPNHELNKQQMMKAFQFICDCQECIEKTHRFQESSIAPPATFMSRKDLARGKEYLKTGWQVINANEKSRKIIDDCSLCNSNILYALAYYATFPY